MRSVFALILMLISFHAGAAPLAKCSSQEGAKVSRQLVMDCLAINQASHPPCNDANPCKLIRDWNIGVCDGYRTEHQTVPRACIRYPSAPH
jgi:hypothetical protein